jgi:hypothetical protein
MAGSSGIIVFRHCERSEAIHSCQRKDCPLMEAQVVIELAGGIAEAIHRGEQHRSEVLALRRPTAPLTLTWSASSRVG